SQNGDEVYAGGDVSYDGYQLMIFPEDYAGNIGVLNYSSDQNGGDWFIGDDINTDSTNSYGELEMSSENRFYNLESYYTNDGPTFEDADVSGSSGIEGAVIDLTVADSVNTAYNGINIFSSWMSLDEPLIELPYYLNDANQDSVLVTDQFGNLSQKSFASFGTSSRWILNGTELYDTLDYIGIGTANPQSLLAVAGTITSQKVKVTQSGWSDYVFDSAYALRPISEVEEFIRQNKHLPEIPSASEVKKDGIDIGANQALMLKKIEELTLYVIEQNKELQELKDQNNKLTHANQKIEKLQLQIEELKKLIVQKN
ncbi:MAG TPA: hypothetical protein VK772_07605, partial [Puia sp.]|nr:hypothetical protein [Puia sp.]